MARRPHTAEAGIQADGAIVARSVRPPSRVEADHCLLAALRRRERSGAVRSRRWRTCSNDDCSGIPDQACRHRAITRQKRGWCRLLSATVVACYTCSLPGCAWGAALKVGTCRNGSPPVRRRPPGGPLEPASSFAAAAALPYRAANAASSAVEEAGRRQTLADYCIVDLGVQRPFLLCPARPEAALFDWPHSHLCSMCSLGAAKMYLKQGGDRSNTACGSLYTKSSRRPLGRALATRQQNNMLVGFVFSFRMTLDSAQLACSDQVS